MFQYHLPIFDVVREKLRELLAELSLTRVYTNITKPGSGTHYDPGPQTIKIVFGTSVADLIYCLKVYKSPNYTTPAMSIPLVINSTTYDLTINIEANTSYMFKIVPCEPGTLIVMAGSIGITSAMID